MKYPNIWKLHDLGGHLMRGDTVRVVPGGSWAHARPLGYPSISQRIKAAWLVFCGKADAVVWEGGQ
jgi:hypothetical protein